MVRYELFVAVRAQLAGAMTELSFTVPGRCIPCPRPRVVRGKKPYFPRRYTDWLDSARVEAYKTCGRPLWEGPVVVCAEFYGARPNADIDNLLKSVLDAIQGVLIVDDKQVVSIMGDKYVSEPPMTGVTVNQIGERRA